MNPLLIVGLRNPGEKYRNTRHNIGEKLVIAFSSFYGVQYKNSSFNGMLGNAIIDNKKVLFLLPSTYMNLSGFSVRMCLDFHKISLQDLLILCDDVEIPFGEFRIRSQGGTGGHNGLKHIQEQLGTSSYTRLRIGIGRDENKDLADYVLEKFSDKELEEMEAFMNGGIQIILKWIQEGVISSSQLAGELNHQYKLKGVNIHDENKNTPL
ncbi:MAG: aminoacyl-tRNA hydrolase [Chlamydiales bacterium]|nr:aminoacyl-tRNA hydrolase [Chlamydiales bacterium]